MFSSFCKRFNLRKYSTQDGQSKEILNITKNRVVSMASITMHYLFPILGMLALSFSVAIMTLYVVTSENSRNELLTITEELVTLEQLTMQQQQRIFALEAELKSYTEPAGTLHKLVPIESIPVPSGDSEILKP